MNSLYKRQLFLIFAMVIGAFVLLSISVMIVARSFLVAQMEADTQKNAKFLSAYTTAYLQESELSDEYYRSYIKNTALLSDSFLFVTAIDGSASYATDGRYFYPIKRNDVSYGLLDDILYHNEFETVTDLGGIFTEERYIYGVTYMENIEGVAVPRGYVIFSHNSDRLDSLWDGLVRIFVVIVLVVVTMTLALVSYLSAKQVKPLNELALTAWRFGQGELSARIEGYEGRSDEVGALTREFNAMASSLEQAEEQRRDFISNVSHELKTPMTTIAGFAEGLLDGTVPEGRREKSIEIILSETRRLSRLVEQMLNLSRLRGEETVPQAQEQFDLIELIAQVIISMEGKIVKRQLDVDVDIPEGELLVWGVRDGVTQVCYNLLDNAIKFATEASVLTVSVEILGQKVAVSVKNHGETLDKDELPRLFQQFHKADDSRHKHPEGLGLGLYLVKNILANLHESISVTSEDGLTCFTFTLSLVV